MGQLIDRLLRFARTSTLDVSGDLGHAQDIIDADADELRRAIDALRDGAGSGPPPTVTPDVLAACQLLGIKASANIDEVKAAYRNRIRAVHPDVVASKSPEEQRRAEIEAKAVNAAYVIMQRHLST